MINYLVSSLVPLTLLLTLLLLIRQPVRMKADANTCYSLWLLLPLALMLYHIELPWHYVSEVNSSNIQSYLVEPNKEFKQHLNDNNLGVIMLKIIWLVGIVSMFVYWFMIHVNFKKSLKLSTVDTRALPLALRKVIPPNLAVKQSHHLHSPILLGLFQTTLVIPEDFTELYQAEQQELIIAHEVCHYSHHHMWANQVALLLLALFWFHPLAWRAYAAFRQDQEHSCDQTVLARKQTRSRIQYCKALVLAAETSPPNAFTLMSFKHNGEKNFMLNRIEQIKAMSVKSKIFTRTKLTLVAIVSTAILAGVSYAGNHLLQDKEITPAQINVHPIHRIEPKYPIKAARAGIEGSVVLKFDIESNGSVSNAEVVNAKPAYIFDKTALTALNQWRYNATGKVTKNLLVQLDYLMDNSSSLPESLIERIKVTH